MWIPLGLSMSKNLSRFRVSSTSRRHGPCGGSDWLLRSVHGLRESHAAMEGPATPPHDNTNHGSLGPVRSPQRGPGLGMGDPVRSYSGKGPFTLSPPPTGRGRLTYSVSRLDSEEKFWVSVLWDS